jgi:hypothetical protein
MATLIPEEVRGNNTQDVNNPDSFKNLFDLFIHESINLSSDKGEMADPAVFTVRPRDDLLGLASFDVLIATKSSDSTVAEYFQSLFREAKGICLDRNRNNEQEGTFVIDKYYKKFAEPAFNITKTDTFLGKLHDFGHVITPDSLIRVMHLNEMRNLKRSVVYIG